MKNTKPLIFFEHVDLGYGKNIILPKTSFAIYPGEFVGVVGPNGAGKSTLLKTLLGLVAPVKGNIVRDAGLYHRLGYVPQRDRLDGIYPLTSLNVVVLGMRAVEPWWKLIDPTRQAQALAALEHVDMADFADASFAELSGGQRQRVLIARAMAINPTLLVLDEPTSGVDNAAEESILDLLSRLNKKDHKTILMVSHRIDKMKSHVSRWIRVEDGKIHE